LNAIRSSIAPSRRTPMRRSSVENSDCAVAAVDVFFVAGARNADTRTGSFTPLSRTSAADTADTELHDVRTRVPARSTSGARS
jgi:hypothetical protein